MNEPLDDLYLTWLYCQVGSIKLKQPSRTYWLLFKQLYTKEFVWIIPNDDNRAEDGRDLRYKFRDEEGIEDINQDWMDLGCSMLEMLVALSQRLSFEGDGKSRRWFWHLIENLNLNSYNDKIGVPYEEVNAILDRVIWRTYNRDGNGGLFPLRRAARDQRNVELWYQMSAYLLEDIE